MGLAQPQRCERVWHYRLESNGDCVCPSWYDFVVCDGVAVVVDTRDWRERQATESARGLRILSSASNYTVREERRGSLIVRERGGMAPRSSRSSGSGQFHPPTSTSTFKDLLIFEERLKQNAERYIHSHELMLVQALTHLLFTGYRSSGASMKVSAHWLSIYSTPPALA